MGKRVGGLGRGLQSGAGRGTQSGGKRSGDKVGGGSWREHTVGQDRTGHAVGTSEPFLFPVDLPTPRAQL